MCLGTISLIVALGKSAVLKTSIFVLRTSTLYCLHSIRLRKIPAWSSGLINHFHMASSLSKIQNSRATKVFIPIWHKRCKFISVCNFTAQKHALFVNQSILNFRVMVLGDTRLWSSRILKKYNYLMSISILQDGEGSGVILREYKPHDLQWSPSKNIAQKPHKTWHIYKEHKILVHIWVKNDGIHEITWHHVVHNLHNYANFQKRMKHHMYL